MGERKRRKENKNRLNDLADKKASICKNFYTFVLVES
jgi:hypothetical protein